METSSLATETNKGLVKNILIAGLVVGTLDISAASIQTLLNDRDPLNMLKFVASGIFGEAAFKGGLEYSFFGLFFHYCIAMIWTILFFIAYPRLGFLSKNRIVTGIVYGIFVQLCMSFIVLPLANTPPIPFRLIGMIKAALILIGAIGIPLAFFASRFFKSTTEQK
jgi:hypothetical protein